MAVRSRDVLICVGSVAAVTSGLWLPLEADASPAFSPALIVLKSSICFLGLLVPLLGWGEAFLRACESVATRLGFEGPAIPAPFRAATAALAGMILVGIWLFATGLVLAPTAGLALALLAPGYAAFIACRPAAGVWSGTRSVWRTWNTAARALAIVVGVCALIRLSAAFAFQHHQDAYTYHLAVSETWIRTRHSGVYLDNLYSGLSFAPEHYYLLLRLLARGVAEQNALAQLTHVVLGHFVAVLALGVASRRWLGWFGALTVMLFAIAEKLMFISQLPKNDTFVVVACFVAAVALVRGWAGGFVAAAMVPLVVKINGLIVFPALAIGALWLPDLWRDRRRRTLGLFAVAGGVALAAWAPFALNNYHVTGNPLIPLANHLFRSPYAPPESTAILAGVAFFDLTWTGALRSPYELVLQHPLYIAGLICGLVLIAWRPKSAVSPGRDYWFFVVVALAYFFLLQIASGEFVRRAEARHFQVTALLLLPLALVPVWQILTVTGLWTWLRWGVAAFALTQTHADMFARSFSAFLVSGHHTSAILHHKPVMDLNNELAKRVRVNGGTPIVLALSTDNTPMFLTNARFWHRTLSYPVWSWKMEQFTAADWRKAIADNGIEYAIVSGDEPLAEKGLLELPFTVIAERGRYRLIEFDRQRASGSE